VCSCSHVTSRNLSAHHTAPPPPPPPCQVQVYNEEINDLLQAPPSAAALSAGAMMGGGGGRQSFPGRNLKILRDDPSKGAVIEGLLELIVTDREQARVSD
jgi:hypothetical protein